ncbi:MAG: tetratricopeptide repeat protein [Chloroflexi bacterium]|nr:tetratricopeptide repeat protein [Chloroflexota bacterium]
MSEERFRQMMGFLIVTVALITALVLLIQHDAGVMTATVRRAANRYAIEAMRVRSTGENRVGYDVNTAYQSWLELDMLASAAEKAGDNAAAARYRSVQDQITKLSPLLGEKYFGAQQTEPDFAGYESATYLVAATALAERATMSFAVGEAWDSKGDANITHVSLLAVVLALYGLAAALSSRTRWVFMISGSLILILTMAWVVDVYTRAVPTISEKAMDEYARGYGLAYRGESADAIKAFDASLAAKPDYANAYYERGNAYFMQNDYARALEDFEAARRNGKDDTAVNYDLGWAYYLVGKYEDAVKANQRALGMNPNLLGVQMDLALTYLAAGQADDARKEYTAALDSAAKQVADAKAAGKVPPANLWLALEDGAMDLENLFARAQNRAKPDALAPPREMINDANAVTNAAPAISTQLKNMTLALEYTSKAPSGAASAKIGAFKFGVADGKSVKFADKFAKGIKEVVLAFDFDGMANGKSVIVKVYQGSQEDSYLRIVDTWSQGATGKIEIPVGAGYSGVFEFAPGEYLVEVYVDYQLAQSGKFVVQ